MSAAHGDPDVARRPVAGRAGSAAPGQAGAGKRLQGSVAGHDPYHPPCRGYRADQAFHALGQIAQALLRAVRYGALPKSARRHGIHPVIRYVMRATARMVRAVRRTCVRFANTNFRLDWLYRAMVSLEARAPPAAA